MWKYLKVAVTAGSLLVCVLLIGLWVRGYICPTIAAYQGSTARQFEVGTVRGAFFASSSDNYPITEGFDLIELCNYSRNLKIWVFESDRDGFYVCVPYWFFVTIAATIAALPWIKWRFSLRTLLIVMTLLALFFGIIAMSL